VSSNDLSIMMVPGSTPLRLAPVLAIAPSPYPRLAARELSDVLLLSICRDIPQTSSLSAVILQI